MDLSSDVLANYMAITGQDEQGAKQTLAACDNDMEQAVGLFFATADAGGGGMSGGMGGGGGGGAADEAANQAAIARAVAQDDAPIRAPDSVRRETLYGGAMQQNFDEDEGEEDWRVARRPEPRRTSAFLDGDEPMGGATAVGGSPSGALTPGGVNRAGAAGGGGQAGPSGGGAAPGPPGSGGLGALFAPPVDLSFKGNFEAAKRAALSAEKWVLINVQSEKEFATHQLNRDTWSHEAVRDTVRECFVFYQTHADSNEEGAKIVTNYRLKRLPATFVVDPVTGASMKLWEGFVEPDALLEDLMRYLDKSPMAPAHPRASPPKKQRSDSPPGGMATNGGGTNGGGATAAPVAAAPVPEAETPAEPELSPEEQASRARAARLARFG